MLENQVSVSTAERGDSRGSPSVAPACQLLDTRLLDVGVCPAAFGLVRYLFESFVGRLPLLVRNGLPGLPDRRPAIGIPSSSAFVPA